MGATTKIEWTDATFNPWMGCMKVSEACKNCYAETSSPVNVSRKIGIELWGPASTGAVRRAGSEDMWKVPVRLNKQAEKEGRRIKVFCASLADVFEEFSGKVVSHKGEELTVQSKSMGHRPMTLNDLRERLFKLIDSTPHLDWLLLTKRPENVMSMVPAHWIEHLPPNVWMGITTENQATLEERLPRLLSIPAHVHWLSVEPLCGYVKLPSGMLWCRHHNQYEASLEMCEGSPCFRAQALATDMIDWVIVGGETQKGARPLNPNHVEELLAQCRLAKIPFFFKQWGDWMAYAKNFPSAHYFENKENGQRWLQSIKTDGSIYIGNDIAEDEHYIYARIGKDKAGSAFRGVTYHEYPNRAACSSPNRSKNYPFEKQS